MKKLAIVIPVFNEEEAIGVTIDRLGEVASKILSDCQIGEIEFVFVDDGSRDHSAKILRERSKAWQSAQVSFRVVQFSRNFGHSAAVFAGLEMARGDLFAILDADLQDPPELLIPMIQTLNREKADVVYGLRRVRNGEGPFKRMTAWMFYRLMNVLSGTVIPKDTGDFRVITKEVRDIIVSLQEREPFLRGLVAWVGFNQVAFPYDRQPRTLGETKYPLRKMFRFAIQAIMSFSSFPLKIAIYLGMIGIICSTLIAAYALFIWYEGEAIPGWTSLIIGLSFGQSMTFTLIGVIGLYLGRIHTAIQGRPRYIVREESK